MKHKYKGFKENQVILKRKKIYKHQKTKKIKKVLPNAWLFIAHPFVFHKARCFVNLRSLDFGIKGHLGFGIMELWDHWNLWMGPWDLETMGLWNQGTLGGCDFGTYCLKDHENLGQLELQIMRLWNEENWGHWDFWTTRLLDQLTWRLFEFMTLGATGLWDHDTWRPQGF